MYFVSPRLRSPPLCERISSEYFEETIWTKFLSQDQMINPAAQESQLGAQRSQASNPLYSFGTLQFFFLVILNWLSMWNGRVWKLGNLLNSQIVCSRRVHTAEHAEHWADTSEFGWFLLLPEPVKNLNNKCTQCEHILKIHVPWKRLLHICSMKTINDNCAYQFLAAN